MKKENDNKNTRNNESDYKSIIVAIGAAMAGIIMAAIGIIYVDDHLVVSVVAFILCFSLFSFCYVLLKEERKGSLWKKLLLIIVGALVLFFGAMAIRDYMFDIGDRRTGTDIAKNFSKNSFIPITIDLSSHSMHEVEQNNVEPVINMSKEDFIRYLQESTRGEVRGEYYQRYKGDKEQQLFAIVETETEYIKAMEGHLYGTIWYVDRYGARELDDVAKEYIWPYSFFLDDSSGEVFLVYAQYCPEGNIIYVLGVDRQGPYQPVISGIGSDLRINEYEEIEIEVTEKGENSDTEECGTYYFCVENEFKEYGGLEIALGELLDIENEDIRNVVKDLLGEGFLIDQILYRENGIININLSKECGENEVRHYSITLRLDGEHAQIIPSKSGEKYCEGTYSEALVPSIATYPTEFPY